MHQRSPSELHGVSTQQGVSTQRTSQDGSSRRGRGSRPPCLRLPPGAALWAWLVLGSLVIPGAWSFMSEEQEELLVELHNHYRGLVSPSASAMMPLKWDSSLKLVAESYAAKCIWNHNPDLEDTGENLFVGTGPLDLREVLEKWFLENLAYDFNNNSCPEDKMCGHYTQMVWADTHRVGCAFHLCNTMTGLEWERVSFLVCNYYPAGNYEDVRPYVEGDWCSRCPENLQECENNLCVADTVDEDELDDEESEEDLEDPTVVYFPPATSESSLQSAEEEEDTVAPPPATEDPDIWPATTAAATLAKESGYIPPPATTVFGTQPPEVDTTPTGKEMYEEKVAEVEEEEEEEDRGKRKEPADKDKQDAERDAVVKKYQNQKGLQNSGSVSSASLLLACLTGILTLRL